MIGLTAKGISLSAHVGGVIVGFGAGAALVARSPWPAAAVDALTAHVVTVLNVAVTEITDATEGHALTALLAGS